jgi:hypothetical protein
MTVGPGKDGETATVNVSTRLQPPRPGHRSPDLPPMMESLSMMIDYAIVESAELRLPFLVLLLRMARLELEHAGTATANVAGDP